MAPGNTFKKKERLSLNNRINVLFDSGNSINIFPLKILWLPSAEPLEYPAQVLFTVSSKRFKRAVDRNHIKRKLKEVYRLKKSQFYEELKKQHKQLLVCVLYTGHDADPPAEILADKLLQGMERLIRD